MIIENKEKPQHAQKLAQVVLEYLDMIEDDEFISGTEGNSFKVLRKLANDVLEVKSLTIESAAPKGTCKKLSHVGLHEKSLYITDACEDWQPMTNKKKNLQKGHI